MSYLFKGGILNSNSRKILVNSHPRTVFQLVWFSSKSGKKSKKIGKTAGPDNSGDLQRVDPLFNEILGILGTENIAVDKNSLCGFWIPKETKFEGNVESSVCQQGVCGNVEEEGNDLLMGSLAGLEDNGNGVSDKIEVEDVSSVVHKVTEIVRCENALMSMEERLEGADFDSNEEIVEKVLKRCFKVPYLALRFFDWVKFGKRFQHTTNTYNVMLSLAGEAKDFGLLEDLAKEMERNCEKNVKTWTVLVSHYGNAKLIGKALVVFEEMKRAGVAPDAIAYRIMLRALCNAKKGDLALEFYRDMVRNEVNLDVNLYRQLLKCLALCGDVDGVRIVGEDMMELSEISQRRIYDLMLESFCIAGRIRESLELIRDLKNKNISLDAEIFETLVKGLCSKDRITDAMEILEIMKKRDVFDKNIYGIIISAYLRRYEVSKALDIFQEAKEFGNMSVSIYTNLMQHLFKKNEFQKGLELYNEMLRLGIQLDCVAITAVAIGYVRQNCISEAWEVFKSMGEKGIKPTSKSYKIFVTELCKVCETDEILKVLNGMQACKENNLDDMFRQVRSYLEKRGDGEKMNAILQIEKGSTFCSGSRQELKVDRRNQSEPTESSETKRIMQNNDNPDVKAVCQILSSSNDWYFIQESLEKLNVQFTPDLVVEILRNSSLNIGIGLKFFSWIGKQTGYSHNEQSYNTAIKIAGQGKNFKEMRSLFHEMRRRGFLITSDTWTIMIRQYGRTGLTRSALSSFTEMKKSGCKPAKVTYDSLITFLCGKKGRKVDEAIQIYREMIKSECVPDKKMVETYLGCLCEVNKLSDARNCIESLRKFGFSVPLCYSLYFRALCRAGKLEDASALMDEIGSERDVLDQFTYGSFVHALLRRGQLDEALEKIDNMKQIGVHPTVHVYTSLIVHYFKEKDMDRALETLDEMKEKGIQPTIVTYSSLMCGYLRLGKVNDAFAVLHHLKQNGPSPDFKTYSMLIDCLCRIGKSEEALQLISEMLHDGIIPGTINFRTVFFGLNREGKTNLAQVVLKQKMDLKRRRRLVV